jgi:hypothetical protein
VFKSLQEDYRIEGQNQLLELFRENEKDSDADATDDDVSFNLSFIYPVTKSKPNSF